MTTSNKPGTGFWIIAVIALIWNIMGVFMYLTQSILMTDELKAALPTEQIEFINSSPSWLNIVFAIAVFSGLLACLMLLLRKKLAVPLFAISLLMVLIQNIYGWLGTNAAEVYGSVQGYVMPLIVIIISIFLYFYSKGATQKGWLR